MAKERVRVWQISRSWLVCAFAFVVPSTGFAQNFEPLLPPIEEQRAEGEGIAPVSEDVGIAVPQTSMVATDDIDFSNFLSNADNQNFAAVTQEISEPSPFVSVPRNSLEEAGCPTSFSQAKALALTPFEVLPEIPTSYARTNETLCIGSAWRLSSGDRVGDSRFDFSFAPGQSACEDGTCQARHVSSRVKVGLDELTAGNRSDGWFLFAGADDKAVIWRPTSARTESNTGNLYLHDSVTVGDIEAGVSHQRERSELSISYIRRETSYRINHKEKLSDTSDYVGIVLRLK